MIRTLVETGIGYEEGRVQPPLTRMRRSSILVTLAMVVSLAGCTGSSEAPTARFEIRQYSEESGPGTTRKGIGDFAAGEVSYTLFSDGVPVAERQEFGTSASYNRDFDGDVWYKSEQTQEAAASASLRNNLVASTESLEYLRSVADVSEVGAETVRGVDTTHYRATVHLTKLGAPPEYDRYPVEVWVDEDGRTRRYNHHPVGSDELTYEWEFFDFGVDVELAPPPAEKIR